jgi:integrase
MSKYDSFAFWMQSLTNRSPFTQRAYRQHFTRFMTWMDKSADELFDLQLTSQHADSDDPRDGYLMENQVKRYLTHLKDKGLSISYQKLSYTSIKSFFQHNKVPLRFDINDKPRGDTMGGSRIPSKAEVRTMIDSAVTRDGKPRRLYQALLMFLKDSGLRLNDTRQITWSGVMDLGNGFWAWNILTLKRNVRATPMVGPETTALLEQLPRTSDHVFPLLRTTISTKLCELTRAIDGVSPHGLRKYFYANLIGARVPEAYVKLLMGKKVSAYDENRVQQLSEAYIEAYDALRIYPKQAAQVEVDQLQAEVAELRSQLHAIQESRRDTDSLMDALVRDPEYMALVRRKIRELQ